MSAAPPAPPNAGPELAEGFEAFILASRRLEQSFAALKRRADTVDLELASANATLQETLEEKEAILAALPVGVLALDALGATIWTNPEGQRLVDAAQERGIALTELEEGEAENESLCLAVRRVPLRDGALVVVEDRSRLVRLTREVDRLDRLAGLSELALGVAHEIRNPLNGVMGFLALLQRNMENSTDTDTDGEQRRFVDKIEAGLAQVDAIVREMLAFATSPGAQQAQAPIGELIREAATAAGIPSHCVQLAGDEQARVESNALVRVLANLFRNSAEAASGMPSITVTAACRDERFVLRVDDNGPGVSEDVCTRVFDPFVTTKAKGTGLGLALASRVMSFLGGSLELVRRVGPGASFCLTLPLRTPGGQEREQELSHG